MFKCSVFDRNLLFDRRLVFSAPCQISQGKLILIDCNFVNKIILLLYTIILIENYAGNKHGSIL